MEMPYHSMDKSKTSDFAFDISDDSDGVSEKQIPTKFPPPPEWIENQTCYSPAVFLQSLANNNNSLFITPYSQIQWNPDITPEDVLKFALLCISSLLTVFFNILFLLVLCNQSNFKKRWIRAQPRYMFISIGINDLIMGILVIVLSAYPALYKCWPFGKNLCQAQAFLRGTLTQQSSVSLVLLAIERYMASVRPYQYSNCITKPVCILIIFGTWFSSLLLYGIIVAPSGGGGFHFNINGLMVCEPYFLSNRILILSAYLFYFPTTMVLMYCYGTVFHSTKAKLRYKQVLFSTFPCAVTGTNTAKRVTKQILEEHNVCETTSRCSAAISLTFIVLVTPWAIQQVITSCTGTIAPPFVDFMVSWLSSTYRFFGPLVFWSLNPRFRKALYKTFTKKMVLGQRPHSSCSLSRTQGKTLETDENSDDEWDNDSENYIGMDIKPSRNGVSTIATSRRVEESRSMPLIKNGGLMGLNDMYGGVLGNLVSLTAQTTGCDFLPTDPVQREIQIREKYWGEILERAVSTHNIQMGMACSPTSPTNNVSFAMGRVKDKKLSSSSPFLSGFSYQI